MGANPAPEGGIVQATTAETLAALGRLPKDVAVALLAPFDPTTIRVEDCLPEDEVQRLLDETSRPRVTP